MAKNIIDKKQFDEYAKNNFQLYASESISSSKKISAIVRRLCFSASLKGEYKVTFGGSVLYQGFDFDEAAKQYMNVD